VTLDLCKQLRDPGQALFVADHAADVIEALYRAAPRAVEMLLIAANVIRDHAPEAIAHYDETECDGICIGDDCQYAAEDFVDAIKLAEGKQ